MLIILGLHIGSGYYEEPLPYLEPRLSLNSTKEMARSLNSSFAKDITLDCLRPRNRKAALSKPNPNTEAK